MLLLDRVGVRRGRADVQLPYIVETYKDSFLDSECARPRVHVCAFVCCDFVGLDQGAEAPRGRAASIHCRNI